LRVTVGRIVALMLEVIAGRRPAGQLAPLAEARVRRYLRGARSVAPAGAGVVRWGQSGWPRSRWSPATRTGFVRSRR